MSRFSIWLICLSAILGAGPVAAYTCTGTIDWVLVNPSGEVSAGSKSSGLDNFSVCELGTTTHGVGPDACSAILATLLVAKETGAQVTWGFSDSMTCDRSTYNGGGWYWLNDGTSLWYYGPQMQ